MSTQLDQIAKKAKSNPKLRFTSLAHLLTPEFLTETWRQMNRRGASGVDGETTKEFEQGLDTRVQELCERLKRGSYRAPPVRRVEIPKGPGKAGTRPLGIPTVEDRLLQRAVARILEAVFEADFLECSYGFRPGRNPHGALRALRGIIVTKKVGHLFEADIRGYFNHIQHEWLQKMVAHRIADPFILRLIGKWLNAGFMVGGVVTRTEEGSPQGGPISPLTQKVISSLKEQSWAGEKGTHCLIFVVNSNTVMSHDPFDQDAEGSPAECRSWPVAASSRASRSSASVVTRVRPVRAPSISLLARSLPTRWTDRSSRSHCANHLEAFTANRGTAAEIREKQWPDHWNDRSQRIKCISARPKKAWLNRVKIAAHFKFKFLIRLIACSSRSSRGLTRFWCHVASTP